MVLLVACCQTAALTPKPGFTSQTTKPIMTTTIKTNNQPRDFMSFFDFNKKDQKEIESRFDYMTREELEEGCYFFKYKGCIYNICEFTGVRLRTDMEGWHAAYQGPNLRCR